MLQVVSPTPASVVHASSKAFEEFTLPRVGLEPLGIATDPSGAVWFAVTASPSIFRYDRTNNSFQEFQYPGNLSSEVWGMTVDAKGAVWFGDTVSNAIWVLNVTSRTFNKFPIPTVNAYPFQLAFDDSGALWFTELYGGSLVRFTPSSGTFVEFKPPSQVAGPSSFVFDSQGNIWFTEEFARRIGRFDVRTGDFSEFPLSALKGYPRGLAVDGQGIVWATDSSSSSVIRFDPKANVSVSYGTSSAGLFGYSSPYLMREDSRGRIWFNERTGNKIAWIDTSTTKMVELGLSYMTFADLPDFLSLPECCTPEELSTSFPKEVLSIALDAGGNLWFTEYLGNKIGVAYADYVPPLTVSGLDPITTVPANANLTVSVTVTSTLPEPANVSLAFSVQDVGNLSLSALGTNPILVKPNQATSVEVRIVTSSGLKPGDYGVTILAESQDVAVSALFTFRNSVDSGFIPSGGPWFTLLLAVALLAIAASIAVIMVDRRRKRGPEGHLISLLIARWGPECTVFAGASPGTTGSGGRSLK